MSQRYGPDGDPGHPRICRGSPNVILKPIAQELVKNPMLAILVAAHSTSELNGPEKYLLPEEVALLLQIAAGLVGLIVAVVIPAMVLLLRFHRRWRWIFAVVTGLICGPAWLVLAVIAHVGFQMAGWRGMSGGMSWGLPLVAGAAVLVLPVLVWPRRSQRDQDPR